MAEYIEREAAIKVIKDYGKGTIEDGLNALDPVDDIAMIARAVELIPAADIDRPTKSQFRRMAIQMGGEASK